MSVESILAARQGKVQARSLASVLRDWDGALHAHVLGSGDPVVFKASLCLDQLGRLTKFLGDPNGGSS